MITTLTVFTMLACIILILRLNKKERWTSLEEFRDMDDKEKRSYGWIKVNNHAWYHYKWGIRSDNPAVYLKKNKPE